MAKEDETPGANPAEIENLIEQIRGTNLEPGAKQKGRATNTTGIVVKAGGRKIALYLSGRRHAGENLAELLAKREKGLAPRRPRRR